MVGFDSQDAIAFTPIQQQRPVQLELISKTRRVLVPKQEGYAEEISPSLLLLENFEKGCLVGWHTHTLNCCHIKLRITTLVVNVVIRATDTQRCSSSQTTVHL